MPEIRKPIQGVWNIIRFNWPFYLWPLGAALLLIPLRYYDFAGLNYIAVVVIILIIFTTLVSLMVSWYVYDHSGLYQLDWLADLDDVGAGTVVNINAGFDETSSLLKMRFENAELIVFDFYDASKHTAPSIKRARKAYPPFLNTRRVSTSKIPLNDGSADVIFAILSAHEIRNTDERSLFFRELGRILAPSGKIIVVEHLRDLPNFAAYNIGALHFHSRASWLAAFRDAKLIIENEVKITPFITAFFLNKNGSKS